MGNQTSNIIINDDFRNHLNLFDDNAFVISDPPYNQRYHYSKYEDDLHIDDYAELLRSAFAGRKSVIIHYPEEMLNVVAPIMAGDHCEQSVSWVYNSNTAKQHRLVSWWNCKPNMRSVGQPYKNPTDKRIADGKQARLYDWWEINQVKNVSKRDNPHPCPIPYQLAERIILLTTEPGDTVIDPFAGSGTVLQAAYATGRNYIGFDIDATYCDYARKQLASPEQPRFNLN